jgi:hypothetical protein
MAGPDQLPGDLAAAKAYLVDLQVARWANPDRYPADFDWLVEQLELAWAENDRLRTAFNVWADQADALRAELDKRGGPS